MGNSANTKKAAIAATCGCAGLAVSIIVHAVAAMLILRRAGFAVPGVPHAVARGSWVPAVLLTLGACANFLSQSPWNGSCSARSP